MKKHSTMHSRICELKSVVAGERMTVHTAEGAPVILPGILLAGRA